MRLIYSSLAVLPPLPRSRNIGLLSAYFSLRKLPLLPFAVVLHLLLGCLVLAVVVFILDASFIENFNLLLGAAASGVHLSTVALVSLIAAAAAPLLTTVLSIVSHLIFQ